VPNSAEKSVSNSRLAPNCALMEVEASTLAGALAASYILAGKPDYATTPSLGGTVSVSGSALVGSGVTAVNPLGVTSPLGAFVITLGGPISVMGSTLGG
jgi:hypothetical protein